MPSTSAARLTRTALAARVLALPVEERDRALAHLRLLGSALERRGARAHARRVVAERRRYAFPRWDPWAYFADILGITLTPQQEEVLERLVRAPRLLIPSGNNLGKTFILAGWGIFRFDAVAALENPDSGEEEQGARILLPGPDHATVHATIYSEALTLALRAERRGHLMPGERSDKSVLWTVRPKWEWEAFSPPSRTQQNVAHTASGRHHRNQIALIEEGQGVPEAVWKGAEGMCSSEGNQIASSFNPTEAIGPAHTRAQTGVYEIVHLSAFKHPNVLQRVNVIRDAVDFSLIDKRVRADCRDRGPARTTVAEPEHLDFVYALPPHGADERGPRQDGVLGHPDGVPRVYRPTGAFSAQVLGQWPTDAESGLFSPAQWDLAVQRWLLATDPASAPDRVGVDIAREGKDETVDAPSWGEPADTLLRAYAEAELQGEAALELLRGARRVRVGELSVLPKGDGVDTARRLGSRWPGSPFNIDEIGVGSSPVDHLRRVMGRDVTGVNVSNAALDPLPGEPYADIVRTQLYVRAAMLVNRGLADVPQDALLREEIFAHRVEYARKTVERRNPMTGLYEKVRVDAVSLIAKDEVKKLIGRSPNRADAFVLSLVGAPPRRATRHFVPASESHLTI